MGGRKFNPSFQYGGYILYKAGEYHKAKRELKKQIKDIVPFEYRGNIVWIKQLNVLCKEDGVIYELSNHAARERGWYSLAWKTIPVQLQKTDSDNVEDW